MRKLLLTVAAAASAVAFSVAQADAVTGTFQPDNQHVYVGLVVFYDAHGGFVERCTGTLLNARTFLTAGHCANTASGITRATVWVSQEGGAHFDPATGAEDPLTGYPYECLNSAAYPCGSSTTFAEYGFDPNAKNGTDSRDVGLVVLPPDQAISVGRYASLPPAGLVDRLATGAPVTFSGYGVSDTKPSLVSFRERLMASAFVINTHDRNAGGFNLQLSGNPGNGRGGACFGDSGGPALYGSSDVILGVDSFVQNDQCGGQSFAYRVDQPAVISWIQAHAAGAVTVASVP